MLDFNVKNGVMHGSRGRVPESVYLIWGPQNVYCTKIREYLRMSTLYSVLFR